MNKLAFFFSVIFHPVWINLYALLLFVFCHPFFYAGVATTVKLFYVGFIFLCCSVLPILMVLLQQFFGYSKSIMLTDAEDRHVPYIFTAAMYLFVYYLFQKIGSPAALLSFLLAQSAIVIAVLVINFKLKISAHATSFGSLIGLIVTLAKAGYTDMRWMLAMVVLMAGVTFSSRLILSAHTQKEIYSGFFVGLVLMLCLVR